MTQARDTANGTTNYQYDSRGNLISETGVNYTYNNRNQLVTKTEGSDHYTYEYDGRGNLIKETKNGTVIGQYTYDAVSYTHLDVYKRQQPVGGCDSHKLWTAHKITKIKPA